MSEFKDSAIKLFGKTIPLSAVNYQQPQQQEILSNDHQSSSADDHGSFDRNPETSLPEDNSNKELQEEQLEEQKVCIMFMYVFLLKLCRH